MAQTIAEIKKIMTDKFIANESVITYYELDIAKTFEEQFSKVSIESILFYCFAFCVWTLQMIFDTDKAEMADLISNQKKGGRLWYRDMAFMFRFGRVLVKDKDFYDLTGIDLQSIESELVVKFANPVEYEGKMFIKVAGGTATDKQPLDENIIPALAYYYEEVKYGGVKIVIVNKFADHFKAVYDIYYDPMVFGADGKLLSDGSDVVRNTISDFIQNKIDFDGEYTNANLTDALQKITGVIIPELQESQTVSHDAFINNPDNIPWQTISAKCQPESGYFKIYNETDVVLNFKAYQAVNE